MDFILIENRTLQNMELSLGYFVIFDQFLRKLQTARKTGALTRESFKIFIIVFFM